MDQNKKNLQLDPRLEVPLSFVFSGCSGSGKTCLAKFILLNQKYILTRQFTKIFWVCRFAQSDLQKELGKILPIIFLPAGILPKIEDLASSCSEQDVSLLTIDDMMTDGTSSALVNELFVAGRHLNMSIFFLTQNLFCAGRYSRNIRLNTNYLAIFRAIHDRRQITTFFQQIAPKKGWQEIYAAFQDATLPNFGYLLMDFKVNTNNLLRFRTNLTQKTQTLYEIIL
jgi:hypothetical protein